MLPNGSICGSGSAGDSRIGASTLFNLTVPTVDVESREDTAQAAETKALWPFDATCLRGIGGALAATLNLHGWRIRRGRSPNASPFRHHGTKGVHCGDAGAGQAGENCNNMILGVTMIATLRALRWPTNWGWTVKKCLLSVARRRGTAGQ